MSLIGSSFRGFGQMTVPRPTNMRVERQTEIERWRDIQFCLFHIASTILVQASFALTRQDLPLFSVSLFQSILLPAIRPPMTSPLSSAVPPTMQSSEKQHQCYLRTCQKCNISGLTSDMNLMLWGGGLVICVLMGAPDDSDAR